MHALSGWENFYVIVGSSAGALIGLQFVVITLIAEIPIIKDAERAGDAFATPTIVHFGAVLLLSAVLNTPWHTVRSASIAWGAVGAAGFVYVVVVAGRIRTQTAYKPLTYDWSYHVYAPLAAHIVLIASAVVALTHEREALFGVAGAALILLFVGIHNAWDAVTYHVFVVKREQQKERPRQQD